MKLDTVGNWKNQCGVQHTMIVGVLIKQCMLIRVNNNKFSQEVVKAHCNQSTHLLEDMGVGYPLSSPSCSGSGECIHTTPE